MSSNKINLTFLGKLGLNILIIGHLGISVFFPNMSMFIHVSYDIETVIAIKF